MRAEVYAANRDYARTSTWGSPSVVNVSSEDVERGVHFRPCLDCCGTGLFPMPHPEMDAFCVACKGQGLEPVMV